MAAHKTPDNCYVCGVALTDANWWASNRVRSQKRCIACCRAYTRARQKAKPDYYRQATKASSDKLRREILVAYGHACACCGETEEAFLALDHIHNDGAAHRRSFTGTSQANTLYVWREVRRLGFPKDRFQLLCCNCNWAKHSRGQCPHQSHDMQEAV